VQTLASFCTSLNHLAATFDELAELTSKKPFGPPNLQQLDPGPREDHQPIVRGGEQQVRIIIQTIFVWK
jgi:hypothetical protein